MILVALPIKVLLRKSIEEKRENVVTEDKSIVVPTSVFGGNKVVVNRVEDIINITPINYTNESVMKDLRRLYKLHKKGILDKTEYEKCKERALEKLVG